MTGAWMQIVDTHTGETRMHWDCFFSGKPNDYQWTEGNYADDSNRSLFFTRAANEPDDENRQGGMERFYVPWAFMADGRKIEVDEQMTFKMPTGAGQHTHSTLYADALYDLLRVGGSRKPMEDLMKRALSGREFVEPSPPNPYRGTVIQGLPLALQSGQTAITICTMPHDPFAEYDAYDPALNIDPGK